MKNTLCLSICFLLLLSLSCQQEVQPPVEFGPDPNAAAILAQTLNLPNNPYNYTKLSEAKGSRPETHAPLDYDFVTLGRVLFYDKALSADNSISCASCHKQQLAFADDVAFSDGVFGNHTERNSIGLATLKTVSEIYGQTGFAQSRLFWDERSPSTDVQILQTLLNQKEMDMDPYKLPEKLQELDYYRVLWQSVTKDYRPDAPFMSTTDITAALGEFMASIQGLNSKFDQGLQQAHGSVHEDFSNFTPSENLGKSLFVSNCASCHGFSLGANVAASLPRINQTTACNGLETVYEDKGVGALNNNQIFYGHFKIPGLRNVEVTSPYMHDGRFQTLKQVIDHYNHNIQPHNNLHEQLKDEHGHPKKMGLSPAEVTAMVDFLKTLTDPNILADPKWSDPFR